MLFAQIVALATAASGQFAQVSAVQAPAVQVLAVQVQAVQVPAVSELADTAVKGVRDTAQANAASNGDDAGAPPKTDANDGGRDGADAGTPPVLPEKAEKPEAKSAEKPPEKPAEKKDESDGAATRNESASTPKTGDPKAPERDETTNRTVQPKDETGQPVVARDETGQVQKRFDETGQPISEGEPEAAPEPDSLLRPQGIAASIGLGGLDDATIARPGGTDYRAQVALVEGYNSNVVQTQDVAGGPGHPHPSPFTGIDASAMMRHWTSPYDEHEFRVQFRGQHYTPLENYSQPDDGSLNLGWAGQFSLSKTTVLTGRILSTASTVNSSRLSDGPLFQIDPSSQQRTYTLTNARFTLVHEISPRWRYVQGVDVDVSTTLNDAPIVRPDGTSFVHRGVDYVQPGIDGALYHDLDERNIGDIKVRYAPTYTAFLIDYSRSPPNYLGHATTHLVEGEVGFAHAFSERFRSLTNVGVVMSGAPPLDPDRRPIVSPIVNEELVYAKQYWFTTLNASYSYGSANPRLGFGPAVGGGFTMEGTPFPSGALRRLDVIINGIVTRAAFSQGPGSLARLSLYQGSAEIRYGITTWLGLIGGYTARYATFEGADAFPSLMRHIVFFGVSGYWTTDRSVPSLETFVSPVNPPG